MLYVKALLNTDQMRYEKMIRKLDPEINLNSIEVRVPDTSELTQKYEEEIRRAPNNFEKTKLERTLQLRKLVWQKLAQIRFETKSPGFEYPVYFEIIPQYTSEGTILEGTINTLVNKSLPPVFFGRIFDSRRGYFLYFVSPGLEIKEDLFEGVFELVKYRNGEFSIAQLISEMKLNLGPKFIEKEACSNEPFKDALMESIIMDKTVISYLVKFHYCSETQFEPIDLPKNRLRFGFIEKECVGCIIPTPENVSLIHFGDFNVITKSPSFPLVKRVVSMIQTSISV